VEVDPEVTLRYYVSRGLYQFGIALRIRYYRSIPIWLGPILKEGLTIIGWVSLTGPAETLIFYSLPIKRENKILSILMDIPIEIQPA
jgi:hypothetical protein